MNVAVVVLLLLALAGGVYLWVTRKAYVEEKVTNLEGDVKKAADQVEDKVTGDDKKDSSPKG